MAQIFHGSVQVPTATADKEAVNLGQVKNLLDRYHKEPVDCATTSELTGTYSNNELTLASAITKIDDVTLEVGTSILVKDQLDKTQNGIYVVKTLSSSVVLERRDDMKEGKVVLNNTFIDVMKGAINGDARFTIISDGTITVGSTDIAFARDVDPSSGKLSVVKGTITGNGTDKTYTIAHSLNLKDANAYMLHIVDATGNVAYIDNAPTSGNEKNSITFTFSVAPTASESFTVFILGLE